jgi:hypothetical protein
MSPAKRYAKKQVKAITRRRLKAKERHERQQRQAQRDIEALHQALDDLGLPDDLVTEIEGRLRAQQKLLGKIFGLMFPTLFGCINTDELTRTRLGQKSALTHSGCSASTLLAQTVAQARPRYPCLALAPYRVDERRHQESLAMELGSG